MPIPKPAVRPGNPCFSSGPCAKRPGWSLAALDTRHLARSHRAAAPRAALQTVIDRSRALLGMPADWRLAIMPGSDTGAFEAALWSLLGPRGVDVLSFESFSATWAADTVKQLRLDARVHAAPYGALPDLAALDGARDLVLCWNGTTSGVCVPEGGLAPREGLVLCDATSAAFAMPLPWGALDAVTWSWQKALGGEAAHGMLALSPRALARLESHTPAWPMPKVFRLTKGGAVNAGIFAAETINTPSMLCVADALDGLAWAEGVGLAGLIGRSRANLAAVARWVAGSDWASFLAERPDWRSSTSICLRIVAPWFAAMAEAAQRDCLKRFGALLEAEGAALDVVNHRDAPPSLRIWGGATVETADIEALLPWLDWAMAEMESAERARAA